MAITLDFLTSPTLEGAYWYSPTPNQLPVAEVFLPTSPAPSGWYAKYEPQEFHFNPKWEPSDLTKLYPLQVISGWKDHFESAKEKATSTTSAPDPTDDLDPADLNVPVLSTFTLRTGARLRLTPGQRAYLRDAYSITPTPIVEVDELAIHSDGEYTYVKELKLSSTLHIPTGRKSILRSVRITDFGVFYDSARSHDAKIHLAREEAKADRDTRKPTTKSRKEISIEELIAGL